MICQQQHFDIDFCQTPCKMRTPNLHPLTGRESIAEVELRHVRSEKMWNDMQQQKAGLAIFVAHMRAIAEALQYLQRPDGWVLILKRDVKDDGNAFYVLQLTLRDLLTNAQWRNIRSSDVWRLTVLAGQACARNPLPIGEGQAAGWRVFAIGGEMGRTTNATSQDAAAHG